MTQSLLTPVHYSLGTGGGGGGGAVETGSKEIFAGLLGNGVGIH